MINPMNCRSTLNAVLVLVTLVTKFASAEIATKHTFGMNEFATSLELGIVNLKPFVLRFGLFAYSRHCCDVTGPYIELE
jgi:hypothetical protein